MGRLKQYDLLQVGDLYEVGDEHKYYASPHDGGVKWRPISPSSAGTPFLEGNYPARRKRINETERIQNKSW